MHLDHDHGCGEHTHEHTHSHVHAHTHDGHEHTHEHTHCHDHGHTHPHNHEHLHEDGCGHDHSHAPMDELTALMKYMVSHNAAHAKELAELAHKLDQAGNHGAYHKVMDAVADFEKGNLRLSEVLEELKAK